MVSSLVMIKVKFLELHHKHNAEAYPIRNVLAWIIVMEINRWSWSYTLLSYAYLGRNKEEIYHCVGQGISQ